MIFDFRDFLFPNNVIFAPLAGCSDLPYRKIVRHFHQGLVYCEMVKIEALIRHDPHTYRLLDYTPDMHPIGAQLCGSKPQVARQAARMIEDLGFDVLDLNCGCPVDKVTKDGSGSGMLKNPELIGEVLTTMIGAVKIPVTVKIRLGWDSESINAKEIVKIAEMSGAKAITVHGRTRAQAYKGPANWDHIRECKAAANQILVIANGDVFGAEAAREILNYTSSDGVLVARGGMGQPWIAEDILNNFKNGSKVIRSVQFYRDILLTHFDYIVNYQSERQALLDMRRVGCWYLKRLAGVKSLRICINRAMSTLEVIQAIKSFPWQEAEILKDPEEQENEI